MALRTNTHSILSANSASSNKDGSRTTLKEILLDFKVDATHQQNVHKVRMVGEPIVYLAYSAKKKDYDNLDEKGRPKEINVPFPDADFNSSFTRIGNDDVSQCDWAKLGYISNKKYAQNCIERYPDGTFAVKILNKGATVFKPMAQWENSQVQSNVVEGEKEVVFLGGRSAPFVWITADFAPSKPGSVEYTVNVKNKNADLTEDEIDALLALSQQTPEQIKEARDVYEERRALNPYLPEFEDFFVGGHNILNIFKYTPIRTEARSNTAPTPTSIPVSAPTSVSVPVDEDEDLELAPVAPAKQPKQSKTPVAAAVFADAADEEEDDWGI